MKVDFLISGRQAFMVLQHHVHLFGPASINRIVFFADDPLQNDPARELATFCSDRHITLETTDANEASAGEYRFVIGLPPALSTTNKTIVFHEGLLPRYRGFSPLIHSLINGEREIGITAFLASGGYDDGPVIAQEKLLIDYPLTILEAMHKMAPLYNTLVSKIYQTILHHEPLTAAEQDHYLATYSVWRNDEDFMVDWSKHANTIKRTIDALGYPYKGAVTQLNNRLVHIKEARLVGDVFIENRTPGKVIFMHHHCPVVICAQGLLKITEASYRDTSESILPFQNLKSKFH